MKIFREIAKPDYETGRDSSVVPEVEDGTDPIFVARFWASAEQLAVEGLVSVHAVFEGEVGFHQLDDDGEPVGVSYEAPIDDNGILGPLTLRDGRVLHAQEGYLMSYGDTLDDELAELVAQDEHNLVPVHVTVGGAEGDLKRQELAIQR